MKHEDKSLDRVAFTDVLLARKYLRELRENGLFSSDLQIQVDNRGREHIEWLAKIIELSRKV